VLLEQVGKGSFGAVWKAVLDDSANTGSPEYQVAAKLVRGTKGGGVSRKAASDLMTEAAVMALLAGHKNLVSIIGVVTLGDPLIMVLSYCDHGSMLSHLLHCAAEGNAVVAAHKLDFAVQTARGMAHISGKHVVHRDLAARNVLLTSGHSPSNLVCKVADFGLSRCSGHADGAETEDYYKSRKGIFATRWTAPEAMETLVFNQASDVWSFGVVLVELAQDGSRPYPLLSGSNVMALTISGQRHPQPIGCTNEIYQTMMHCWDIDPRKRPRFLDLVAELSRLYTDVAGPATGRDESSGVDDSGCGTGTGDTQNTQNTGGSTQNTGDSSVALRRSRRISVVGLSGDDYEYSEQVPGGGGGVRGLTYTMEAHV
jgi:serine/threonine protein kinase